MGLETPFDILGLYHGVDLLHKSNLDASPEVDRVFLYRRPLLDYLRVRPASRWTGWCAMSSSTKSATISDFSDADMDALEAAASAE